jgi:hypothetical protein
MSYPSVIYSPTPLVDNSDYPKAADVNAPNAEIVAIETALGINPQGTATDVVTRLAKALSGIGNLNFATATTLTVAAGSITPTQNYHLVYGQGGTADDIDTILATNVSDGFVLFITPSTPGMALTLKHATGNIYCHSATDIVLADVYDFAIAIYNATISKWLVMVGAFKTPRGLATLIAGTVTVMTAWVGATSLVLLTVQSLGTVIAPKVLYISARSVGVSFTITSTDVTDTSTAAWEIIEP